MEKTVYPINDIEPSESKNLDKLGVVEIYPNPNISKHRLWNNDEPALFQSMHADPDQGLTEARLKAGKNWEDLRAFEFKEKSLAEVIDKNIDNANTALIIVHMQGKIPTDAQVAALKMALKKNIPFYAGFRYNPRYIKPLIVQNEVPTTTYAGMLWYDTDNYHLWRRNDGNTKFDDEGPIQKGTFADRPPAGNKGNLYWVTDTDDIYKDEGEFWRQIRDKLPRLSENLQKHITMIISEGHRSSDNFFYAETGNALSAKNENMETLEDELRKNRIKKAIVFGFELGQCPDSTILGRWAKSGRLTSEKDLPYESGLLDMGIAVVTARNVLLPPKSKKSPAKSYFNFKLTPKRIEPSIQFNLNVEFFPPPVRKNRHARNSLP